MKKKVRKCYQIVVQIDWKKIWLLSFLYFSSLLLHLHLQLFQLNIVTYLLSHILDEKPSRIRVNHHDQQSPIYRERGNKHRYIQYEERRKMNKRESKLN